MDSLIIYLLTGAIAGLLAGLFGIGGGLVMVPALAFVLPSQGVPADALMQVAVATSLAVISATSISSMLSHRRHDAVLWPVFRWMSLGLVAGSVGGAFVADQLASRTLALVVGGGALLVSAQMFFELKPRGAAPLPGPAGLATAGGVIGLLSALVGIGGGSMTVPLLIALGARPVRAVGTSAACGFAIALASAAGFVATGVDAVGLPEGTIGYVHVSGAIVIAAASVLVAPYGAALAHRLRGAHLKLLFAGFLAFIGAAMLLSAH